MREIVTPLVERAIESRLAESGHSNRSRECPLSGGKDGVIGRQLVDS